MSEARWRVAVPRLGAAAAVVYVVAQLIQRWILAELPAPATGADRLAIRLEPLNLLRLWLVFLAFFPLPVFVIAVIASVREARRAMATAGGVFFLIFILVELLFGRAMLACDQRSPLSGSESVPHGYTENARKRLWPIGPCITIAASCNRSDRKSWILKGEMAEWLKEHA